ncbi:MAG: hypothetical protein DMF07_13970 [Verrucomicrobia bacterium]|nr:MAG: hypothetical protein DMF07_13970 [Verrucomicrobiota bacterium]
MIAPGPRARLHLPVIVALLRDVRLPAVALAKASIDPCEKKKTKRREFARWREGAPPGRRYHGHVVPISTYYSGNGGAKFSKKIRLL